jgi:Exostosin family.
MKLKKEYLQNISTLLSSCLRAPEGNRKKPTALIAVSGLEIKRPLFLIAAGLSHAGYRVFVRADCKSLLKMGLFGRRIFSLDGVSWSPVRKDADLCLTNDTGAKYGRKRLVLDFNVFDPGTRENCEIFFPISFHPEFLRETVIREVESLPATGRDIKVFFAGAMDKKNYDKADTAGLFHLLSRFSFIETVRNAFPGKVFFPESHDELLLFLASPDHGGRILVCDTSRCRIPPEEWFRLLARSEFVLSPPGVVQPYCHNTVEAMAAGAVPVMEYPQVYNPALEDGVNCISFSGSDGLVAVLGSILSGGLDHIALSMGRQATSYYREHLSLDSFSAEIARFMESPAVSGRLAVCQNTLSVALFRKSSGVHQ